MTYALDKNVTALTVRMGTAHMTSGTAVRIRGWGHWPVDRFS